MALASDQRKNRADLVANRKREAGKLAALRAERGGIEAERALVDVDLGPVRYLAILLSQPEDATMRVFILVVALLLDPAAVLLLLAACRR